MCRPECQQRKGLQKQFGNDSNQLTLTNGINFANNITQQVNQQIPQLISVTLASPQHQQTYQTTTSTATMVRNQPILANQAKKQILPRLAQAPMQAATHGLHAHRMPKAQKALKKGPANSISSSSTTLSSAPRRCSRSRPQRRQLGI
jgi:Cu/Zn superoxide dismutase